MTEGHFQCMLSSTRARKSRQMLTHDAPRQGYKIVKGRWIDVNKGDRTKWKEVCIFQKNSTRVMKMGFFFASTPQLEILRLIIIDAATRDQGEDKVIMENEVARASKAPAKRTICVELFEEKHMKEMTSDF